VRWSITASGLAAAFLLLATPAWASDARSSAPSRLCPALAENYKLCFAKPESGNCDAFVRSARDLAALYRQRVQEQPSWAPSLKARVWWGCGTANLTDIENLLARLRLPDARELLRVEPYKSIGAQKPEQPVQGVQTGVVSSCHDRNTVEDRVACAEAEQREARSAYERLLGGCLKAVDVRLGPQLRESEASWQKERAAACFSVSEASPDADARRFTEAWCLAQATRQRTRALRTAYPECAVTP